MKNSTADPDPCKPQSIILVTTSPSRQEAIKALLGVILTGIPIHAAANDAAAKEWMAAEKDSRALMVIDGWSLDIPSIAGVLLLKVDFPESRFLLLLEKSQDQLFSYLLAADKVLVGSISGNHFIEVVLEMIDCDR